MKNQLTVSVGQYTSKGRKELNQDFHDVRIPNEPLLSTKGIAVALADGISSSKVSDKASKIAVNTFLSDYYSTPESWSIKKSAEKILIATNSWLYSQNRKDLENYDKDKGFVCTFSSMVLRAQKAHFFHIGDSRIYKIRNREIIQITSDHRIHISSQESYLARALGADAKVMIDHIEEDIELNDLFLLMTDGVYEHVDESFMVDLVEKKSDDLGFIAENIVQEAYNNGSKDNLTLEVVKVDVLPSESEENIYVNTDNKEFPPELKAGMKFDGFSIIKEIQKNHRSHIFLAVDDETSQKVVIKCPSVSLREDKAYIERFVMEEWVAKRINNNHVVKAYEQNRPKKYLYTVMEFVEGRTLAEWMLYNVNPSLNQIRDITGQIARALQAFHRKDMLHQDIRPENILIDEYDQIKIIDFGSTRILNLVEMNTVLNDGQILGTVQYSAPEYFIGEVGSTRSDMFSLAVIVYQMLSGKFPYGANVARATSKASQKKLKYKSLYSDEYEVPSWIDATLHKALSVDPYKRYDEISEFVYDLGRPNPKFIRMARAPIYERSPLYFWKIVSIVEAVVIFILLFIESQ